MAKRQPTPDLMGDILLGKKKEEIQKQDSISLDFIHSNKLDEIESGINNVVRGINASKIAICISYLFINYNCQNHTNNTANTNFNT